MNSQYVITPDGLRIHVLVDGPEQAPPLILLHGFPSSSLLWRHVIPELAKHFRVYAPDLPGHGQSDKPARPAYDLDFYVGFLLGIYEALGLEQARLACHDIGGMVGLSFAARYPQRITQFVVMDTVPYPDIPRRVQLTFQMMGWPVISHLLLMRPVFRRFMRKNLVFDPTVFSDEVNDIYLNPWIKDAAGRRAFSRILRVPVSQLTEPNLQRIVMPTLILWARKDRVCSIRDAYRLLKDLPDARLVKVADAGHFLQEEKPEIVTQHLLEFLTPA